MNNLTSSVAQQNVQRLFVDEAGDPTLFNSKGESLVGTGCTLTIGARFDEQPEKKKKS